MAGRKFLLLLICVIHVVQCDLFSNTRKVQLPFKPIKNTISNPNQRRRSDYGDKSDKALPNLIAKWGYPVTLHDVITEDGYILTIIRIPHGRNKNGPKRKPVLLHHGLVGDASLWFSNSPDKTLALLLADLGYDVWLANCRGTTYSRRHKLFTDRERQFFDFSMDEIGKYDIPAEIDFILKTTEASKILYVGLSMGGPVFHIAMSSRPEYNEKISLMIGLAPAVYVNSLQGILKLLVSLGPLTTFGVDFLLSNGAGKFLAPIHSFLLQLVAGFVCNIPVISNLVCNTVINLATGNTKQFDQISSTYSTTLQMLPSSTSSKTINQFVQWTRSGNFQMFNYGRSGNLKKYGQETAPLHLLKNTTCPVAIWHGETDILVRPKDIMRLASELPNVILLKTIPLWNHVDYGFRNDINEVLHKPLFELAEKY